MAHSRLARVNLYRKPVSTPTGTRDGSAYPEHASEALVRDAGTLGVPLDPAAARRLLGLLEELARWNRSFNLTAIREPQAMITHHLLDSLAVHPELRGERVADVGTGAGFPGLPLALVNPARHFTLVDSNGKKIRFVAHAAHRLGLSNVEAVQARVETLHPERPFDTILARAYAALPQLLHDVGGLSGAQTRVLAMKGRRPDAELRELPGSWRLESERELVVPGLNEPRCLLVLAPA